MKNMDAGTIAGLLAMALFLGAPAGAADFTWELDTLGNGTAPLGAAPWMTAHFADTPAGVQLTLSSLLEPGSGSITEVAFNVNPSYLPSSISVAQEPTPPIALDVFQSSQNAQTLGMFRGYDILIKWASNKNDPSRVFNEMDVVSFTLSSAGLTAADFQYPSANSLFMVAKVQGIPLPDGSTISGEIVAVPEPTICLLGGFLLIPLLAFRGLGLRRPQPPPDRTGSLLAGTKG